MTMEFALTPSQTAGPYFHLGLTNQYSLPQIAGQGVKGERVWLKCRVLDADNAPLNDAMIEIWQADSQGKYNHPDDNHRKVAEGGFRGFGTAATEEDGSCQFEAIKPGSGP